MLRLVGVSSRSHCPPLRPAGGQQPRQRYCSPRGVRAGAAPSGNVLVGRCSHLNRAINN